MLLKLHRTKKILWFTIDLRIFGIKKGKERISISTIDHILLKNVFLEFDNVSSGTIGSYSPVLEIKLIFQKYITYRNT